MPTRVEQATMPNIGIAALATVYNGAAPGANTNILTDSVKVSPSASALRITVCLSTGSVFNVRVTDGTNAHTQSLNGGTALTANCLYTFTIGARRYSSQPYTDGTTAELSYNFQVAADGVIETLFVEEATGPTI